MKKYFQILFIIIVVFVFTLPVIRFNKNGTISEKENRNLATKPFILENNSFNELLFKEYDAYFSDRFGGRYRLINLNTRLKQIINGDSLIYNDNAIQGKNGWWFYISESDGNNLEDFYKRNLLDNQQLLEFEEKVKKTKEWFNEQNIPCIFLVCPNKHSVYSENYYFKRPKGITRSDQLVNVFEKQNISYIFPRDYLISKKTEYDYPLYFETDTHWNSQGAYLTSLLLKETIEKSFPNIQFPIIKYETNVHYSMTAGDILPMLGVAESKSTLIDFTPIGCNNSDYYEYILNAGVGGVHTKGTNKNLPSAIIYRDSYFNAMEQFISPLFSEAEYKWKQFDETEKDYILEHKPDIVIFENVERYSLTIVQ